MHKVALQQFELAVYDVDGAETLCGLGIGVPASVCRPLILTQQQLRDLESVLHPVIRYYLLADPVVMWEAARTAVRLQELFKTVDPEQEA